MLKATGNRGASTELVVTFAAPLPGITCGPESKLQWVNDALTGPGFRLHNNSIQSRRFGALVMGRDGEISANRFHDNPASSILLLNDDDYDNPRESRMGFMPRDIRIVGNSFTNSTRCTPDPYHAGSAISLEGVIASAVVGPNPVPFGSAAEPFVRVAYDGVSGITIENNRFDGFCRGSAVLLGEAVNTSVRNNTIGGPPNAVAAAIKVADSTAISSRITRYSGGQRWRQRFRCRPTPHRQ